MSAPPPACRAFAPATLRTARRRSPRPRASARRTTESVSTRRRAERDARRASPRGSASAASIASGSAARAARTARSGRRCRRARAPPCRRRRGDDRRLERHRLEHGVRRALVVRRLHEQIERVMQVGDVGAMAEQAARVAEAAGARPDRAARSRRLPSPAMSSCSVRMLRAAAPRTRRSAGRTASAARAGRPRR